MATTKTRLAIELIPWDHHSEAHVGRMVLQRRECGWMAEEVPAWRVRAEKGLKSLFWVTLSSDCPNREAVLLEHTTRFPEESTPLKDTATTVNLSPREPRADRAFVPIGHVALNKNPTPDLEGCLDDLSDEGVYWIASLYVSHALHSRGVGRAVMAHVESLAAREPLNGTAVALDTAQKEVLLGPEAVERFWKPRGIPVPKVSTEEWFQNQGYEIFKRLENHRPTPLVGGGKMDISLVLMRKYVAQ